MDNTDIIYLSYWFCFSRKKKAQNTNTMLNGEMLKAVPLRSGSRPRKSPYHHILLASRVEQGKKKSKSKCVRIGKEGKKPYRSAWKTQHYLPINY